MEKVRVIYIERADGEKKEIEMELQWIGEIRVGIIRQVMKRKEENYVDKTIIEKRKEKKNGADKTTQEARGNRKLDKQDKELLKRIKRMCDKETIVVANERTIRDFGLSNTLFELRRKELLDNVARIIDYLCGRTGTSQRKSFLLMVDSVKWNEKELKELLNMVKNRYENIYIDNRVGMLDVEELATLFYEEYGIVLHFVDGLEARQLKVDTAFFLVKEWDDKYAEISYCNSYLVAEFETGQRRRRKRMHEELYKVAEKKTEQRKKENYMGLVYSYCGRQIPYEVAVVVKYHEYMQHFFERNVVKNEISIVAIYDVGWYN